ncbi:MAG: hypothetical protein V7638_3037 [Acidobacteriota bacterium]|jgi:hypothetical protein
MQVEQYNDYEGDGSGLDMNTIECRNQFGYYHQNDN